MEPMLHACLLFDFGHVFCIRGTLFLPKLLVHESVFEPREFNQRIV
jgi:hypothetical protein